MDTMIMSENITRNMSIDKDKLWKTDMVTPITSKQNVNTGAQGDCFYLPVISMISNRSSYDSTSDKNEHLRYVTDNCCRSNLTSNEQNDICFSTSSATFIVSSSSPPVEITLPQDDHIIYSSTDKELSKLTRTFHHQLWFKQHWMSVVAITGIIVIFITIITIIIH